MSAPSPTSTTPTTPSSPPPSSSAKRPTPSPHPPASPVREGEIVTSHPAKRRRTKPRAFDALQAPTPTSARKLNTGSLGLTGPGIKLSCIPNIQYALHKLQPREPVLELLHRILFNSSGLFHKRKSNIRSFSGFVPVSPLLRSRTRDKLLRAHFNLVRRVALILDLPVSINNSSSSSSPPPPPPPQSPSSSDLTPQSNGDALPQPRDPIRAVKLHYVDAILSFLDRPSQLPNRPDLAERDRIRRTADRHRAQQARLKQQQLLQLQLAHQQEQLRRLRAAASANHSDDDGDEDLDYDARTWIQMANENKPPLS